MVHLFRQHFSTRKALFVLGEGLLIFFAVSLTAFILVGRGVGAVPMLQIVWPRILLIVIVTQVSLYFNDLYEFSPSEDALDQASRLVRAIGVTTIILAVVYFLWPQAIIGRWIFLASLIFLWMLLFAWRHLYELVVARKILAEKAMIIGSGALATDLLDAMREKRDASYNIVSLISNSTAPEHNRESSPGTPLHRGFDDLCDYAESSGVRCLIVALDEKRGQLPYRQLLNCKVRGIDIVDGESFYERITGKLLVEKINPSWLIFSDGFVKSPLSRLTKRLVGLLVSAVLLVLTAPLVLLVAAAIKLETPGPVFFLQQRVGQFGKLFQLVKFRSMLSDAEAETGPTWASEDDPRITKVGRIIRRLRIDELPQLWNVLRGDMSFVGPRPERPFFVEKLGPKIPFYGERFCVKPGITGWAQVKYQYGSSEQDALEKLKYDLYYIKNMSFAMDVIIILQTAKTVLLGEGSR